MRNRNSALRLVEECKDSIRILIDAINKKTVTDQEALRRLRVYSDKLERVQSIIEQN